jgi:long-chain acyl-CoA synthetase
MLDARAHPDKLHTVGRPTHEVRVAIRGDDGAHVGPGIRGEILLDAPRRIRRYWNRPDLDAERLADGWLRTGDVGSLDEQGFLTCHGRLDDLINCGGFSFFPAEAERELGPVPGVAEYIIAGVPDPKGVMEQVPWAFVVPAEAGSWSPADFSARARMRLLPHMVPRRVVVIDAIPLIVAGKPDRRRVVADHGPAGGRGE